MPIVIVLAVAVLAGLAIWLFWPRCEPSGVSESGPPLCAFGPASSDLSRPERWSGARVDGARTAQANNADGDAVAESRRPVLLNRGRCCP